MHILVTGAAGFIGSHLCEALLKKGDQVVGLDNFNDFYSPDLKRKNVLDIHLTAKRLDRPFWCHNADICDREGLDAIFKNQKIDLIVHLAAMAGVRPSIQNPLLYEKVNGMGTCTLLESMKGAGICHLVFGSSSSVYGLNKKTPFAESDPVDLPFSPYASTKRANELTCQVYHQLYQMNVAVLRFFTVYGPRQRPDLAIRKFTELIFQGKPIPIFGDGSNRRDYTYIDDIIDGILKSIDWLMGPPSPRPSPIEGEGVTIIPSPLVGEGRVRGGAKYEIFNLGEQQTASVLELIELLEKSTGKKAKKEFLPPQPGDVPVTYADIIKSKKILGYNPKTPLIDGIPLFIEWYRTLITK